MAFPWAAAGMGAAALIGTGGNAAAQGKMNQRTKEYNIHAGMNQFLQNQWAWKKQNEYNEGLWNRQNQYNENLWHRMNQYNEERWRIENEYNSPSSQMKRFKEAGLNPNLIYGQSNTGGSISAANFQSDKQNSARLDGQTPQGWNPRAPQIDLNGVISSINNFRESAARVNNLEEQNKLIKAQAIDVIASAKKKGVETGNMERLIDYQVDALEESTRKTRLEQQLGVNKDLREEALNRSHLLEAIQRMRQSQLTQRNIGMDIVLKQLEYELKRHEVSPRNAWRKLSEFMEHYDNPAYYFQK